MRAAYWRWHQGCNHAPEEKARGGVKGIRCGCYPIAGAMSSHDCLIGEAVAILRAGYLNGIGPDTVGEELWVRIEAFLAKVEGE